MHSKFLFPFFNGYVHLLNGVMALKKTRERMYCIDWIIMANSIYFISNQSHTKHCTTLGNGLLFLRNDLWEPRALDH